MEDRETPRMRKCGESKTTGIMMATVPQVSSVSGLRKFQADGFLFERVYLCPVGAERGMRSNRVSGRSQEIDEAVFFRQ